MGMHQNMTTKTMPTMAELGQLAQIIEGMMTFDEDGVLAIQDTQMEIPMELMEFILAVHDLTSAILD